MKSLVWLRTAITVLLLSPFLQMPLTGKVFAIENNINGFVKTTANYRDEFWYIDQVNRVKYHLSDEKTYLTFVKKTAKGIRQKDLDKFALGWKNIIPLKDADGDGLANNFEQAIGTNPADKDTDKDKYSDKEEVLKGYDPVGNGRAKFTFSFSNKNKGRLFINVDNKGSIWYINPADAKKYFFGNPAEAWTMIKILSSKVKYEQINSYRSISLQKTTKSAASSNATDDTSSAKEAINAGASAISLGDIARAQTFFAPEMSKSVEHTVKTLDQESRNAFSLILKNAKFKKDAPDQITFTSQASFRGKDKEIQIVVKKIDGKWLIASI